jgi:hypothetical protein
MSGSLNRPRTRRLGLLLCLGLALALLAACTPEPVTYSYNLPLGVSYLETHCGTGAARFAYAVEYSGTSGGPFAISGLVVQGLPAGSGAAGVISDGYHSLVVQDGKSHAGTIESTTGLAVFVGRILGDPRSSTGWRFQVVSGGGTVVADCAVPLR